MARVVKRSLAVKTLASRRTVAVWFWAPLEPEEFDGFIAECLRRRSEFVDEHVVVPPQPGSSADFVAKRARLDP